MSPPVSPFALSALLMILVGPTSSLAQDSRELAPKGDGGRSAWIACTSIPEGLENPVTLLSGDRLVELELPKYMVSAPVKVPDDGILRIVRAVPDAKDPEKTDYVVLAEATVSEGVREALVTLIPLPKPRGGLLFQSGVQDLANFKGGDRMFINLSKTNIRVKIGGETVAVPVGRSETFVSPKLAKPTNAPISYSFYHPERKEWKILGGSTIVLRPTRRTICVFNEGSRTGKIRNHKILFPIEPKAGNGAAR